MATPAEREASPEQYAPPGRERTGYPYVITGHVFADLNGDGVQDVDEPGVAGVGVSDLVDLVLTDADGGYELANGAAGAELVYVCTPADFKKTPRFYYRLPPGDCDYDGDADLTDFAWLQVCMTSQALSPTARSDCLAALDSDLNGEFDLRDLARFAEVFGGPGAPPPLPQDFDFPLAPEAQPDPDQFDVAAVGDPQIVQGATYGAILLNRIAQINELTSVPRVIVTVGDLVENEQNQDQWDNYLAAAESSTVPLMNALGDHDLVEGSGQEQFTVYRRYCGPEYYSFDIGDWHFLIRENLVNTQEQQDWIAQDLALLASGKSLVVIQHDDPTSAWQASELDLLNGWGTQVLLTGHWHAHKMYRYEGMSGYNLPGFMGANRDSAPPGFRMIHIDGDAHTSSWKYGITEEVLAIVSPTTSLITLRDNLQIIVNAYLPSSEVVSAAYLITTSEGAPVLSGPLARDGTWTWRASPDATLLIENNYDIEVTVADDKAAIRSLEGSFQFAGQESPAIALGSDWPQFGGDAARTGCAADVVAPPLTLSWASDAHGHLDFSSPVLKQGSIYVGVGSLDELTTNHGVIALDAQTGAERWFFVTDTLVRHSAAVDDSAVYAVAQGGSVYAIDPADGTELRRVANGTHLLRWQNGAPALHAGTIYAGNPARLMALDCATQQELWAVTPVGDGDWRPCGASPATNGTALMLTGHSGTNLLRHRDAIDGSVIRNWPAPYSSASPTIAANVVILPILNKCIAFNIDTGATEWEYEIDGGGIPATTPAVSGNTVVFGMGGRQVIALDLDTGAEKWVFTTGGANLALTPASYDDCALVGAPTISGNLVYIGSADGKLYALELTTGTELWSHDFGVPILSAACVSGNTLFVTAYDGHVYALTAYP